MAISALPFKALPGAVYPEHYDQQLKAKVDYFSEQLFENSAINIDVHPSPPSHYRMRAEFRIWHQGDESYYCMHDPEPPHERVFIENFPIATQAINKLMPDLLKAIKTNITLKQRLFGIDFLGNLQGDIIISLLYHKKLDTLWETAAQQLKQQLNQQYKLHIIGRSRKQKITLGDDYLYENFTINNKDHRYQQYENSFTQPNASINQQMLDWVFNNTRDIKGDALELFCGNGNFTFVLAENFNKVLATELSKSSIKAAKHNIATNKINNVDVVRLSSQETCDALAKTRPFNRLKHIELDNYQFSTVFVDPPRAGLDETTLSFIQQFNHIIYISCNPETLKENLKILQRNHTVTTAAFFDQFPYTKHLKAGVMLKRK